jgi:hypothetical protein
MEGSVAGVKSILREIGLESILNHNAVARQATNQAHHCTKEH